MQVPGDQEPRTPPLLAAAAATLRQLGPRRFSLTAVAEAAQVSRGTVHNILGTRDAAVAAALDYLSAAFIETLAAEVNEQATLADQAAAAAPNMVQAWNNLGVARRRQNKAREAVLAFERALELDQNYALAYKNLAVALEDLGDKERAARAYRAYASYAPTAADVMQAQQRASWLER